MDEDEIQTLKDRIKASQGRIGLSFEEAATTLFSPELLADYTSANRGAAGVAAFRIEAFLSASKNYPIEKSVLGAIAAALRLRVTAVELQLTESDIGIAIALWSSGDFGAVEIASLIRRMKGVHDFAISSKSSALLPIIGTDFIADYLSSTELFETGGMGGPQRPLIREMSSQALRDF